MLVNIFIVGEVNWDEIEKLLLILVDENVTKEELENLVNDEEIDGLNEREWEGSVSETVAVVLELVKGDDTSVDNCFFVSV